MSQWRRCKRRLFIKRLRKLGSEGPYSGTRHQFMILKNHRLYLIDFGLGFHSNKVEDKAVDLHLIQQALNAKHFKIADECFNIIIKNYKPKNHKLIIDRIKVIESRGRYKGKIKKD